MPCAYQLSFTERKEEEGHNRMEEGVKDYHNTALAASLSLTFVPSKVNTILGFVVASFTTLCCERFLRVFTERKQSNPLIKSVS